MRSHVLWAVAGLVLGAATWAVGDGPDRELAKRFERLRSAADRAWAAELRKGPPTPLAETRHEIALIPIGDLGALMDHTALSIGRRHGDGEVAAAEPGRFPLGTPEEVLELIRSSVMPRAWERSGQLAVLQDHLFVAASPAVVKAVRAYLDETLRPLVHRFVTVDAQIMTAPRALVRRIGLRAGGALDDEAQRALDAAREAETAVRSFRARANGRVGQRLMLWQGVEQAVVTEAKPQLASRLSSTEPVVTTVHDGAYVAVRVLAPVPGRFTLELSVQHATVVDVRTVRTKHAMLQQVRTREGGVEGRFAAPDGRWVLAGTEDEGDDSRLYLVRATTQKVGK